LRFLCIILRVLRLEVSVYTVFTITNQFQTPLAQGGGGGVKNRLVQVTVNSNEENSYDFCPNNVQEFGPCTSLLSVTSSHFFPSSFPFLSDSSPFPLLPVLVHAPLCLNLLSTPSAFFFFPIPLPNPIFTQTSLFQFLIPLLPI
jgi:hypothetical protein